MTFWLCLIFLRSGAIICPYQLIVSMARMAIACNLISSQLGAQYDKNVILQCFRIHYFYGPQYVILYLGCLLKFTQKSIVEFRKIGEFIEKL